MESPLLSPGADSSALDEPKVDHLVKLEESEDVEGEPNRLVKYFKLRIHIDPKTGNFFLHQLSFSDHVLKVHKHEIIFLTFLQKPKPYGPQGL